MASHAETFVDDIFEKGMLHGIVVRSEIRCGAVKNVTMPILPEEYFVIREDDIPGDNVVRIQSTEIPILCEKNIQYAGQAILLICGPDDCLLEDLKAAVKIIYEESTADEFDESYSDNQLIYSRSIRRGDAEQAFASAFQITEGEYETEPSFRREADPCGAFADVQEDIATVVVPSKWIYHVRDSVAAVLGRNASDVVVRMPATAGLRDGFLWNPSLIACHAALLSSKSNRPVRIMLSYDEKQRLLTRSNGVRISQKTALNKNGSLRSMRFTILADAGSYPVFGNEMLDRICLSVSGQYRCENLSIDGTLVRSNNPPAESYVGFGFDASFFSTEVHVTRLAEVAGEDPYQWKKKNLLNSNEKHFTNEKNPGMPFHTLLDTAAEESDYKRKYAANELLKKRRNNITSLTSSLRGIGIAVSYQGAGFIGGEEQSPSTVTIKLQSTGNLEISSSAVHREAGTPALLKLTAAEILGLKPEQISITPADTSLVPDSGPSMMSRNISVIRRLIQSGCQTIQKKRFRSPLPLEINKKYRKPAKQLWDSESFTGTPFTQLSWAATVAEVEIDPVSLEINLRGVWLVIDAGKIIDKKLAFKNVELELARVFEWCRGYEVQWESSGNYEGHHLDDQAKSAPPVHIFFNEESQNQTGAIEGLAFSSFTPAFINAVSQATGFYFDGVPLTTSHFWIEL